MTGRHHYSIPGASFLKPRGSLKAQTQSQKVAAASNDVPSSSRDTRQPTSARAYYGQEAVAGNAPVRPPSATAYRTQHSNTSVNNFHASGNTRQSSVQRPTTTPPASSSRTRHDASDPRSFNILGKMFGRKQTPASGRTEEKQKSSRKHHHTSQAFVAPTAPIQSPYPSGPSASRSSYDAQHQARDSDREDQNKQKMRDDRVQAERMREERERMRAGYAAYRAKMEEVEREQAAAVWTSRTDRISSRPSQDERRQQEYESDNARRRRHAQQMAQPSQKQEARQSQYLYLGQAATTAASRPMAPARDGQQTLAPQAATRPPGVPVQLSTSSQSTSASHQAQAIHPAPPATRAEPTANPSPVPTSTPATLPDSAPAPPPKVYPSLRVPSHPLGQNPLHQSQTTPVASMLPPHQPSVPDNRYRLEREAAERDALLSRERERELTRRREAEREAVERRETSMARERTRDREAERRREPESEIAEQERERKREQDRERRRAPRPERERMKELERAGYEKRRALEREDREHQKQNERVERDRPKAFGQQELEKQKEAERLRRDRKEKERAERERLKAEVERQEDERVERERVRDKLEKEHERGVRLTARHRSHRDKSQSMPTNTLLGAASGSDTDRIASKKDSRRRSQSYPTVAPQDFQLHTAPSNGYRPDSKAHATDLPAAQMSATKKDAQQTAPLQYGPVQTFRAPSTAPPIPPAYVDIANLRSASAIPSSPQTQERTPPKTAELQVGGMQLQLTPPLNQPLSGEAQAKLVSIYASQGPSDRSACRPTQKIATGQPIAEQRLPRPTPTTPAVSRGFEEHPRSSLDQPSRRSSLVQPNNTPPVAIPPTPQDQPQHEPAAVAHDALAQQLASSHPRHAETYATTSIIPASKPPQSDTMMSGLGNVLPVSRINPPPPMGRNDDQPAPANPGASTVNGTGFSRYSQAVLGASKELPRAPQDHQQVTAMTRAPSNNSTRSPLRKPDQLSPEVTNDAFTGMPRSRASSDASRSMETGEHRPVPHPQPQLHTISSQHQQHPAQSIAPLPMYSSTHNTSLASRARPESATNFHQQAVPSTHSYSQSLPQQFFHVSSKDDVHQSRHDNLPNARATAHIPAATDVLHQQYPPFQATSSQSKAAYNPSANVPPPVQSQQSHAPQSNPIPDTKQPSRAPANSNNVSSYSAAVAGLNLNMLSQTSTMLSHQQSTHPPNPSMYHDPSNARNHVSAHQPQRLQQAQTPIRPAFTQHSNGQPLDRMVKSSVPPSVRGVISLDSPSLAKAPLQQSGYSAEQALPQRATHKPASQSGPLASTPQGSPSQLQSLTENRSAHRVQTDDTPPPLTSSSSSHESHDEILMTPASLDQARAQVDVKQPPERTQPSEKKKGRLFGIFRSNSTKSTKDKENRFRVQQDRGRQAPVSQHDQRTETVNKPRSTRPPSIMVALDPNPKPTNLGPTALDQQSKQQSRAAKPVPPPITIPPPETFSYRLFSTRSRRYRTMSSASLEAVDGTANNTVVGSPTSSRRSPTPSGPMTPPVRDPIEATLVWRNNEEGFLDPGSQRRRRPGVTFDLKDNSDGQKDGAQYRRSRQQRVRRDSLR